MNDTRWNRIRDFLRITQKYYDQFYKLYKRQVEATEIQAEAILEIREILVRSSENTADKVIK